LDNGSGRYRLVVSAFRASTGFPGKLFLGFDGRVYQRWITDMCFRSLNPALRTANLLDLAALGARLLAATLLDGGLTCSHRYRLRSIRVPLRHQRQGAQHSATLVDFAIAELTYSFKIIRASFDIKFRVDLTHAYPIALAFLLFRVRARVSGNRAGKTPATRNCADMPAQTR
jgi:hypothetical protein